MTSGKDFGTNRTVTLDEMEKIVELTEEGKTRPDIAEKVNRSTNTIYRYQKKLGLI